MDCREARRRLSAMVDGRLDPSGVEPLEEHLAACPACGTAARLLEEVRHHYAGLPRPAAPGGLTSRVMARIAESGARNRVLAPLLRLSTAAAAALLFVTTAGIVLSSKPSVPAPTELVKTLSAESALDLILSEISRENAPPAAPEVDR